MAETANYGSDNMMMMMMMILMTIKTVTSWSDGTTLYILPRLHDEAGSTSWLDERS